MSEIRSLEFTICKGLYPIEVVTSNDSCYHKGVSLENNLKTIQQRIASACSRVGRNPNDVQVLLATKTVDTETLLRTLQLKYRLFGENKVQELIQKQSALSDQDIEWHFIGRLQSNKVKEVLPRCSLIHSLDRLSLAQEIQKRADQPTPVLIEIHSSSEPSKTGVTPENFEAFVQELKLFDKVRICGVMTMAENSMDPLIIRRCFRQTKQCFEHLKTLIPNTPQYISMGMSNDFELAIEEGSNLVRIGSAAFGHRPAAR